MMNELRQLVRRFVSGELDYREFRREFGPFFSQSDAHVSISKVCELIESECSAFEHGIINQDGLKLALNINFVWAGIASRTATNEVTVHIDQQQPTSSGQPTA